MKKAWGLLIVAACSHGAAKAKAPAEPEAPPGALVMEGEKADEERARFAIGFVDAVARRDDTAIDAYTDVGGLCSAIAEKAPPNCVDEMRATQGEALGYYQQAVPESWSAGETSSFAVDAAKGIYLITVNPADGNLEKGVVVTVVELGGRRYVLFPQKKE